MGLTGIFSLLAMGSAPASGTQADPRAQFMTTAGMLVLMLVMFYFVLFRPQQKKQREHAELLRGVKPGDKIVTSGGVVGIVISVKEKTLSIRSADSKLEITKAAIGEVTERGGEPAAS